MLDDPYPEEVYDTAMELKDNSNSEESKSGGCSSTELDDEIEDYCEICRGHVGHECWDCPYKSKGIGWGYGPCKKEDGDPREHWSIEMVKQCVVCGGIWVITGLMTAPIGLMLKWMTPGRSWLLEDHRTPGKRCT